MKRLKLLVVIILIFALSACSKSEVESYETKNRKVDSVFDKIDVPNKAEREKNNKEETESEKEIENEGEATLESESESERETENEEDGETKTTLSNVNLRAKPIVDSELITVIDEGEKVIILEEDAGYGWTKIEYEGNEGFVDGSLLE